MHYGSPIFQLQTGYALYLMSLHRLQTKKNKEIEIKFWWEDFVIVKPKLINYTAEALFKSKLLNDFCIMWCKRNLHISGFGIKHLYHFFLKSFAKAQNKKNCPICGGKWRLFFYNSKEKYRLSEQSRIIWSKHSIFFVCN